MHWFVKFWIVAALIPFWGAVVAVLIHRLQATRNLKVWQRNPGVKPTLESTGEGCLFKGNAIRSAGTRHARGSHGRNRHTDVEMPAVRGRLVRSKWARNVLTFLVVLIVMEADNDAGAVSTYVQAGARYGTKLLWLLLWLLPVTYFIREMVEGSESRRARATPR